ncbi:MAG: hypothetical protein JWQ27_1034 [Ferruginibacter sp.]|nr:hypothetical protein [Ferruginibacter sp.]
MKKLTGFLSLLLICYATTHAQQTISWQESPVSHKVSSLYSKESAVVLNDDRVYEYRLDDKNVLWQYNSMKRLIKLNDEKAVEMYNKVYVYIPANAAVEELKARAIQPNGKVVNLPENKFFDEEENGKKYKKFAIEGIEKGSEIEYFVRYKREISTFGIEVFQTSSTAVENASFTLISPEYLVFAVKGYNGFSNPEEKIADKKRIITVSDKNIDALNDDKYASNTPYSKNVQFKLSYNLDKNKNVRLYTWNELAKNVYNNYHNTSESDNKAINAFYKLLKLNESGNEEAKIIAIEDYFKTTINIDDNANSDDADNIASIVKTKVAGKFGAIRLLLGLFQKAGINYQLVYPSKRDDFPIDEEFENYRLIDDLLIYFPANGNFLDPASVSQRYPFVEPYYAGTRGLFLKGTTIGDFKTAIASFDTIPLLPYEKNATNLYVNISFNKEMDSLLLKSKQMLSGYSAAAYRPAYNFLPQDKQDEFTREIIKTVGNSDIIKNIRVENTLMTDGAKDLALNILGDVSTAELIEKAGSKILVKIGEVIGTQEQMYQEKKRQLPILIQYPHALDREIILEIPEGYTVKNLKDITKDVTDAGKTMGFVSGYSLDGSKLTINLHEYYKEIHYPVSEFESFRKVVNASADFNKVVLVLEKR